MTITINYPKSGRYQGHNRLIAAAIGVALVVSLAVVVQATTSGPATESTRDIATDQVFDLDQVRSAETARLVSINEIPWEPAVPVADAQAADTARLVSINEIPWEPSTLGASTADGDLAFFLSINDVDG